MLGLYATACSPLMVFAKESGWEESQYVAKDFASIIRQRVRKGIMM